MGGAGLRGAHTERRCTGVVDGAGLAGGEMSEDPVDDLGSLDARDDAQRAATHTTVFDVDVEDALEALHPAHGGRRRMGFAGGSIHDLTRGLCSRNRIEHKCRVLTMWCPFAVQIFTSNDQSRTHTLLVASSTILGARLPTSYLDARHTEISQSRVGLIRRTVSEGVPPKLIIFNGFLVGAGAQHCQGQIRQRDRFATTMTIPTRNGDFGVTRAGSEWPARRAHSTACPNA